ncbi:MAG: hypothetical protein CL920_34910 [Deltaproteobacteria bacterium]|nr:hypothetical protein [Deltaproteobacteria bacterium]
MRRWFVLLLFVAFQGGCHLLYVPPAPLCTGTQCPTSDAGIQREVQTTCGDNICDLERESCASCPQDCKCPTGSYCSPNKELCIVSCGDGICSDDDNENCRSCPKDCACKTGTLCTTTGLCTTIQKTCGDKMCDQKVGENCLTCPVDCPCVTGTCNNGTCLGTQPCGDGKCDPGVGENCTTCPKDCTCPVDQKCAVGVCSKTCGDRVCDTSIGENCANCYQDCSCSQGLGCLPNGQCAQCQCTATQRRCNGIYVESCSPDCQTWNQIQQCTKSQYCALGTCKNLCGNGVCDKKSGESCTTCPVDCPCNAKFICEKGICIASSTCGNGVCDANENCDTCASDCLCKQTAYCSKGLCTKCPKCTPGTYQCISLFPHPFVELSKCECDKWTYLTTCKLPFESCNEKLGKCE